MNPQGAVFPNLVGWQVRRDRQKESRPPTQAVPRESPGTLEYRLMSKVNE